MAYEFNHYYELQNVATGKYVNVLGNHEDGTVKNGETVNLFSRTNNPDQRWALENFGGNGNVRIVLQRGEGWYALNYNTRNTNCIVWHLNTADDTDTVITTVEVENRPNTYYLMLRDRSIYLTAVGTALKWSAYTGEEEQMFTILEPGTGSDGSDSGEVSNVPDSKLVTKFIPAYEGNYTKDRKAQGGTISEITIHHCASILTIDALGALWQREGRKGSSHYGVSETNIGQYVHESDVAWTNGNWEANCRAVTIETSNSGGAPEWPVSDTTFQTLVTLVADIARRNGLGKLGAKKNDIWLEYLGETIIEDPTYTGEGSYDDGFWMGVISNNLFQYSTIRVWWQDENDHYKYIDISGLVHRNFIYGGKSVKITAKEALEDSEESGFLVPLHYATFRDMRLVDSTQMSTACVFLVINCYVKQKKKWWQSGIFAVIFVIVIAVVSVIITGGSGFGLLGSHMTVGSSLGLTGMGAAIAGSIANALAALVLTTMITKLTENMGVFGGIIGAVLGIVLTGAIQNLVSGGGFSFDFSQLMRADNILKLLDSAGQGYAAYVRGSVEDMQQDLIKYQEDANNELKRIREQFFEQFGYGGGQIDPMMFVGDNSPVIAESRDTFLARTLMTGSDVAQMSHDLLHDYVELTTTLPNVFT